MGFVSYSQIHDLAPPVTAWLSETHSFNAANTHGVHKHYSRLPNVKLSDLGSGTLRFVRAVTAACNFVLLTFLR